MWENNLHAIGVDLNSRMPGAIRAPDPVRERRHAAQVRHSIGGRTYVHIAQIGEGGTETDRAAPSFPYGAASLSGLRSSAH